MKIMKFYINLLIYPYVRNIGFLLLMPQGNGTEIILDSFTMETKNNDYYQNRKINTGFVEPRSKSSFIFSK